MTCVASLLADADLPDLGQSSIIATSAVVGTVIGGAFGLYRSGSLDEAESDAFTGGLLGGAAGIFFYLSALLGGVL